MKIIAFYLPQYHTIPENDEWWGEGFTEWTNVKKAVPRFKGHYQPRIPLDNNYYCLLDKSVMEHQAQMANSYGIDAFCYYHYWFKGKLLLEKPLEDMLENKNVTMPFCLSWANESWSKNWDGCNKETLIKQDYGNCEDWVEHFNYLLKFFIDDRYIKIDNKPMLIIYKPHLIDNCKEMIDCWTELAINNGFDGLYTGYQNYLSFYNLFPKACFDFGIEFEPWYTIAELQFNQISKKKKTSWELLISETRYFLKNLSNVIQKKLFQIPYKYSYEFIVKKILKRPTQKNIMKGCFPGWDNTPRHISDLNATIITGNSPKMFEKLCCGLKESYTNEFLFINAWNEWAEGAYLEPDEKYGFEYLEAIKTAFNKK